MSDSGTGRPARVDSNAEVNAPTARKPPWPSEIWPVKPTRMFSPTAPMTAMRMVLTIPSQYESRTEGAATRAAAMMMSRANSALVCRRASSAL